MSQSLIGSRYELHVAREGAAESKEVHDYYAIHPGDIEEIRGGRRPHRLRALVGSRQHGGRPGHALRRLSHRLPAALPVLPQPGYLAQAQRPPGDRLARDAGRSASTRKCSRSARAASRSPAASRWCSGHS